MNLKPWIKAARLRTLPLAVSNIVLGSLLAAGQGRFSLIISISGLATAVLLQVLSNYANDYGDFVHGADKNRVSKYERALQSGGISPEQMRNALIILSFLTFITGISLIISAAGVLKTTAIVIFIIAGILCIVAAITYTVGKKPYGYIGLGDISVFIFFGIVGVCGIYILQTGQWDWFVLLPASSLGLLSMGVLNVNNIRDIDSDRLSGKNTLVVRIGIEKAKNYHTCLISAAVLSGILSTIIKYNSPYQLLYLLTIPLFIRNIYRVRKPADSVSLDDELRNLSLTTFFYSVIYGVGSVL